VLTETTAPGGPGLESRWLALTATSWNILVRRGPGGGGRLRPDLLCATLARRLALALVALCAPAAASAPAASAAVSVSVTGDQGLRISVSGASQTEIGVRPTSDGTKLEVTEQSAQMVLGSGCVQVDSANPQRFRCNRPPLNFLTFVGGTGRDRLFVSPGSGDCDCSGGAGNDELRGADGADLIDGGSGADVVAAADGDDVLRGGDGNDAITGGFGTDQASGGNGDDFFAMGGIPDGPGDVLRGEDGRDEVSYGSRRTAVRVTSDASANDGAPPVFFTPGEADLVSTDIEVLTGGTAADTLSGFERAVTLNGGAGNDTLTGGLSGDLLIGGTGSDVMSGKQGNDVLNARDAIDDQITDQLSCGSEFGFVTDTLDADVRDDDTRALPEDCETVSQGMVGEHPNVVIRFARRGGSGRLMIGLRCPRKTRNGCAGRLAVGRVGGKGTRIRIRYGARVRYSIRRGRGGTVLAPVRGGVTPRRGAEVRVRSAERGQLGPRTTFKTLKVRR